MYGGAPTQRSRLASASQPLPDTFALPAIDITDVAYPGHDPATNAQHAAR